MNPDPETCCGFIALAGRPNVGKSTLLNTLVGGKVSIVSPKVQTTRHRIRGVHTESGCQWIFVDTPGIHGGARKALNRHLNRTALVSASDVDLVIQVVEAGRWTDEDQRVLTSLREMDPPLGLAINKVDRFPRKDELLPFIDQMNQSGDFEFIVPLSALKKENVERLLSSTKPWLVAGPFLFPKEQTTDRDERFQVAEAVREKVVMTVRQGLPYAVTVLVDDFQRSESVLRFGATVWVERESQKSIVIGRKGAVLKEVGTRARKELEKRLDTQIHLRLWVEVKRDWSRDEQALQAFGYDT